MGRKKINKSLIHQVNEALDSKLDIGQSIFACISIIRFQNK
jgi:hypothetical protein